MLLLPIYLWLMHCRLTEQMELVGQRINDEPEKILIQPEIGISVNSLSTLRGKTMTFQASIENDQIAIDVVIIKHYHIKTHPLIHQ